MDRFPANRHWHIKMEQSHPNSYRMAQKLCDQIGQPATRANLEATGLLPILRPYKIYQGKLGRFYGTRIFRSKHPPDPRPALDAAWFNAADYLKKGS